MKYLEVSTYDDVPKVIQILIEGNDALSQEEKMAVQATRPQVQTHSEAGMISYDDFYFWYFDYEDRVIAYDAFVAYYPTWTGLSGVGEADPLKIPFITEFLMYPVLFFAGFSVILLTPFKFFYIFLELILWKVSPADYGVNAWNVVVSFVDALYMIFLSPFDILFKMFILLPFDVFNYLVQLGSWLIINFPTTVWYFNRGWEILYGRLYWLAMWIIFHYDDFKTEALDSIVWIYIFWPFMVLYWYADYLLMAFGWNYYYR